MFPKLLVTKKLYFMITKGENRAISRAETLGRLCFCGFKIVAEKEIGDDRYFIAQKVKTSSIDENPSYGPLVKFSRVGLNGGNISVYKFRTMHPYSEYLQQYIFEMNKLQQGGKFKNDFRVTTLGKFMRKTWLDELPMLYNWIKGEINLIGVPPFYADLPKTFDEICESERKYVNAYLRNPARTQWMYFWKAFGNIVFRGARSG